MDKMDGSHVLQILRVIRNVLHSNPDTSDTFISAGLSIRIQSVLFSRAGSLNSVLLEEMCLIAIALYESNSNLPHYDLPILLAR